MMGWGGMIPGGAGGGGFQPNRRFEEQYHCYSVAYADKAQLEVRLCVWLSFGWVGCGCAESEGKKQPSFFSLLLSQSSSLNFLLSVLLSFLFQ